jgi:hypothetical protein
MEHSASQFAFCTQSPSATQNSQNLLNLTPAPVTSSSPSIARSRSKILEAIQSRPWSHIFRQNLHPSNLQSTQTTQSSVPMNSQLEQVIHSSALGTFQSRVIQSNAEISKSLVDLSSSLHEDKGRFQSFISDVKGLFDTMRKEAESQAERHRTAGQLRSRILK